MITHVVLFKLVDPTPETCSAVRTRLVGLDGRVPALRGIEVGVNVGRDPRAFEICLITRFDSLEDLNAYQIHPEHQAVAAYIKSVADKSVVVDFES